MRSLAFGVFCGVLVILAMGGEVGAIESIDQRPDSGDRASSSRSVSEETVPNEKREPNPNEYMTFEEGSVRSGWDYKDFDLEEADPGLCSDACLVDPECRAFTYVRPGIQGDAARCWLKNHAPPPQESPCCVSGAKVADS